MGTSPTTDFYGARRTENISKNSINVLLSFYRLAWVQRCWPRATPDFGSTSTIMTAISSFLLQDIPRHPDTRLFDVRGAFKSSSLLGFRPTHIYRAIVLPPAALRVGSPAGDLRARATAVPLYPTDTEPLMNTLVPIAKYKYTPALRLKISRRNSSVQAVCDTSIACGTGCVCPH